MPASLYLAIQLARTLDVTAKTAIKNPTEIYKNPELESQLLLLFFFFS